MGGVEYRGEAFDNYLGSPDHLIDEDPIISNRLYVLAIMFGVGFMLAALYIFKTRRRRITDEANEAEGVHNIGVDSPAIPENQNLPRYVEVDHESDTDKNEHAAVLTTTGAAERPNPQSSPEGVASCATVSKCAPGDIFPQQSWRQITEESSKHVNQESHTESNRSKVSQRKLRDSSRMVIGVSQKAKTLPEEMSLFQELQSIAESSDVCCGDDGNRPVARNSRHFPGGYSGERPFGECSSDDSQSLQTSRMSNTSK